MSASRMARGAAELGSGGEIVCIRIAVKALQNLERAIVGFIVRDRLGQNLFGDNTYLTTLNEPFAVAAGESFRSDSGSECRSCR